MHLYRYIFVGIVLSPFVFSSVNAQQKSRLHSPPEDVAIDGYSPVSYFTKGIAERGSPKFSVDYEGRTYYLASSRQAEKFRRNPEKYKPLFDVCPYSLNLGRKVSIDPNRFKIVGGHLLLFHNSEEMDALKKWNEKGNDKKQLEQAKRQYESFRHQDNMLGNKGNILDIEY